jgi:hypothetical protein
VCTDFKGLQVKVPIIFFGTPVLSARRDRRYLLCFLLEVVASSQHTVCMLGCSCQSLGILDASFYEQKGEEAIYGCCIPAAIEMALGEV